MIIVDLTVWGLTNMETIDMTLIDNLKKIEQQEFAKVIANRGTENYDYALGRWGMVTDLIREAKKGKL